MDRKSMSNCFLPLRSEAFTSDRRWGCHGERIRGHSPSSGARGLGRGQPHGVRGSLREERRGGWGRGRSPASPSLARAVWILCWYLAERHLGSC